MIARRTCGCAHTRRIGTSGQILTCQRALVNTDQAEADGTLRRLTSTITARGSSSAALMTASRRLRYVELSSIPPTTRIDTPRWVSTSIRMVDRSSSTGIAAHTTIGRKPFAEHGQGADRHRSTQVAVSVERRTHYPQLPPIDGT